ncbi:hypothetical protein D3C81_1545210 [compost metagenome]
MHQREILIDVIRPTTCTGSPGLTVDLGRAEQPHADLVDVAHAGFQRSCIVLVDRQAPRCLQNLRHFRIIDEPIDERFRLGFMLGVVGDRQIHRRFQPTAGFFRPRHRYQRVSAFLNAVPCAVVVGEAITEQDFPCDHQVHLRVKLFVRRVDVRWRYQPFLAKLLEMLGPFQEGRFIDVELPVFRNDHAFAFTVLISRVHKVVGRIILCEILTVWQLAF